MGGRNYTQYVYRHIWLDVPFRQNATDAVFDGGSIRKVRRGSSLGVPVWHVAPPPSSSCAERSITSQCPSGAWDLMIAKQSILTCLKQQQISIVCHVYNSTHVDIAIRWEYGGSTAGDDSAPVRACTTLESDDRDLLICLPSSNVRPSAAICTAPHITSCVQVCNDCFMIPGCKKIVSSYDHLLVIFVQVTTRYRSRALWDQKVDTGVHAATVTASKLCSTSCSAGLGCTSARVHQLCSVLYQMVVW